MERTRNQYTEAVDQEMQRRAKAVEFDRALKQAIRRGRTEDQRQRVLQSIAENRARKQTEIQRYIDDARSRERIMRPAILQLDANDVRARLEEINQGIWNNRGSISVDDILDERYRRYVIGKKYTLALIIPSISSTITDILKDDSGYVDGDTYQYDGSEHWSMAEGLVGHRTKYTTEEDIHALTVSFISDTNKDLGVLRVSDTSTKRSEQVNRDHLDRKISLSPFDVEGAVGLLHEALVQSSIHRSDNPIEDLYQEGLRKQEWLRRKGGSGYTEVEYNDIGQAPLTWRLKRQGQLIVQKIRNI